MHDINAKLPNVTISISIETVFKIVQVEKDWLPIEILLPIRMIFCIFYHSINDCSPVVIALFPMISILFNN